MFTIGLYKQTLQILQQIIMKICQSSAGIRTHGLQHVSLLPYPLDQGSRPFSLKGPIALQASEKSEFDFLTLVKSKFPPKTVYNIDHSQ